MKRIANERKYVENMIKNKTLNVGRPGKDINSLIKYLYEQHGELTKEEMISEVNHHLLEMTNGNAEAVKRWQVSIKEYVNGFMGNVKKFRGLSHVESIYITQNELDKIRELKNKKLEYIAFSLLVYLKIRNEITGRYDNQYIKSGEDDIKLIRKMTGFSLTTVKCAMLIKELQDLGYTENGVGGAVNCKLNYVDYNSKAIIEIMDFTVESIHLYYSYYLQNKKIKHCKNCYKAIPFERNEAKRMNATMFCTECARKNIKEKGRKRKG